jgi:hypothetical protein
LNFNALLFVLPGFLLFFWERAMHIRRAQSANFFCEIFRIASSVLQSTLRLSAQAIVETLSIILRPQSMAKIPIAVLLLPLLLCKQALAGPIYELSTEHYLALVVDKCKRALDCRQVEYLGVTKATGATIRLRGRSILSGNAPNWRGYIFKDGDTSYVIEDRGDHVTFSIEKRGKTILEEKATLTDKGGFE